MLLKNWSHHSLLTVSVLASQLKNKNKYRVNQKIEPKVNTFKVKSFKIGKGILVLSHAENETQKCFCRKNIVSTDIDTPINH